MKPSLSSSSLLDSMSIQDGRVFASTMSQQMSQQTALLDIGVAQNLLRHPHCSQVRKNHVLACLAQHAVPYFWDGVRNMPISVDEDTPNADHLQKWVREMLPMFLSFTQDWRWFFISMANEAPYGRLYDDDVVDRLLARTTAFNPKMAASALCNVCASPHTGIVLDVGARVLTRLTPARLAWFAEVGSNFAALQVIVPALDAAMHRLPSTQPLPTHPYGDNPPIHPYVCLANGMCSKETPFPPEQLDVAMQQLWGSVDAQRPETWRMPRDFWSTTRLTIALNGVGQSMDMMRWMHQQKTLAADLPWHSVLNEILVEKLPTWTTNNGSFGYQAYCRDGLAMAEALWHDQRLIFDRVEYAQMLLANGTAETAAWFLDQLTLPDIQRLLVYKTTTWDVLGVERHPNVLSARAHASATELRALVDGASAQMRGRKVL